MLNGLSWFVSTRPSAWRLPRRGVRRTPGKRTSAGLFTARMGVLSSGKSRPAEPPPSIQLKNIEPNFLLGVQHFVHRAAK
jgi:hypothetical protein